jgi:hypothetical protein
MLAKIFPKNEHIIERVVRVILGLGLLSLVFFGPQTWWGLLGIVPLATGALGSCPAYTLFGWSTCRMSTKNEASTAQT